MSDAPRPTARKVESDKGPDAPPVEAPLARRLDAASAQTGSAALWRRILDWPGGGGKSAGWRGIVVRVARTALLFVACSVALVMIVERRAIYHPVKATARDLVPVAAPGIELQEVRLETADGVRIYAWFVDSIGTGRARSGRSCGPDDAARSGRSCGPDDAARSGRSCGPDDAAMLYFHGNSGNIFERRDWILSLAGLGIDVMVIDYRGYGLSEGSPTEHGLYADAEAAYRYLTDARGEVGSTTLSPPRGVPPERIVIYGKSLGGGPACELARRHGCAGLILMSTFTNIPDMANRIVPVFPAGWFTRERFDNLQKVAEIETPKLIIHSRADELVPFRMGEALYEAAAGPKRCLWFDEGGHGGLCFQKRPELLKAFGEFLEEVVPERPPPTPRPDRPPLPRTERRRP